ncbi:MAG TPA: class I SAM-dependent methyltransferase [Chryseolinea sp.]|nr:class I SAM-dependent methyltransferase [Chryseolinea sp.]
MSASVNSFDRIAPMYDVLARIVYGKSIRNSQTHLLEEIENAEQLLIIGGGTGWLLKEVLKVNANGKIHYVDASAQMIDHATRTCNDVSGNRVEYVHGTEELLPRKPVFDAVIANFYFDLFPDEKLLQVLDRIVSALKPNAILLVSDFRNTNSWWSSVLLGLMYRFFRLVSNIQASRLPQWQKVLRRKGFKESKTGFFYNGFIQSSRYDLMKSIQVDKYFA